MRLGGGSTYKEQLDSVLLRLSRFPSKLIKDIQVGKRSFLKNSVSHKPTLNKQNTLELAKSNTLKWQSFQERHLKALNEFSSNLETNKSLIPLIKKSLSYYHRFLLRNKVQKFAQNLTATSILGSGSYGLALEIYNHDKQKFVLKILFEGNIDKELSSLENIKEIKIEAPTGIKPSRIKDFKNFLENNFQQLANLSKADLYFFTNRNCLPSKSLTGKNRSQRNNSSILEKYFDKALSKIYKKEDFNITVKDEEEILDKQQIAPLIYIYKQMFANGGIDLVDAGSLQNSLIDRSGKIKILDFASKDTLFKIQNSLFKKKPWRGALWQIFSKDIMQSQPRYESYREKAIAKFGKGFYQQRLIYIKEALTELIEDQWVSKEEIYDAIDYLLHDFKNDVERLSKGLIDNTFRNKYLTISPDGYEYLLELKNSLKAD